MKDFSMKTIISLTSSFICLSLVICLLNGCRCSLLCPTLYKYSFLFPDNMPSGAEKDEHDKKILDIIKDLSNGTDLKYEGLFKYPGPPMVEMHRFYNAKMRVSVYFSTSVEEIYICTLNKSEYILHLLKCLKSKLDLESLKYTFIEEEEVLPFWSLN